MGEAKNITALSQNWSPSEPSFGMPRDAPPKASVTSRKTDAKEIIAEPALFSKWRLASETLNAVLKERRRLKTGWAQTKPSSSVGHHARPRKTLLIHRRVSLSLCYPAKNCISEFPNQCESKVRILM